MNIVLLAATLALTQAPVVAQQSVAVLPLEAKGGVKPDAADLLYSKLVSTVRGQRRFSRVVGTKEIESLLGFEKQRQLLSCESSSCIAEVAGALGVDYLIGGNVGLLGKTWVFNLFITNTRTAQVEASASKEASGDSEEALLKLIPDLVVELLSDLGRATAPVATPAPAQPVETPAPQTAASPAPTPTPAPSPATTSSPPVAEDAGGGGGPGRILMALGAAGIASTVIPLAMIALGAASSGGMWAAVWSNPEGLRNGPLTVRQKLTLLQVGIAGGTVAAGTGVVLAPVVLLVGVGVLVAGVVVNML
ncbi:MAG: hypothetical protein AB2A00_30600 [Myxococcota bacterium]